MLCPSGYKGVAPKLHYAISFSGLNLLRLFLELEVGAEGINMGHRLIRFVGPTKLTKRKNLIWAGVMQL
jgi:hypothetical protein